MNSQSEHSIMKTLNSIRFALLAAAALLAPSAIAGKPTPPPPPPPSSGTLVLDYSGSEATGAENFGLTVAPSGAIYASGISYDSAWRGIVLASGDSGNSWSLADQFPSPGRSLWFWDIAGGITSDAAGNVYVAGLTYDDAVQPGLDQWYVRGSGDAGATWNTVDDFVPGTPPVSSGDITGIAVDASGNVYVAGMADDVSGNWAWTIRKGVGGTSFSTVDVVPNSWVTAVFAHPTWGIFAVGTRNINGIPAWVIRRSTNGGATWSEVNTFQLQSGRNSTALGIGADANGNLYVVGRGDTSPRRNTVVRHWLVRKSTDGGNSWSTVDDFVPGGDAQGRCFATTSTGDLYVAGVAEGHWIVRKNPGGTGAWTTVDDFQYAGAWTAPHAIAADASGNLFVGGGGGGHWLIKKY